MKNVTYFGKDAQDRMLEGVKTVYDAVSRTMGASGRNVAYRQFGAPMVTNDGVSIARKIDLEDEAQSIGADLVKQASERTNDEVGDATSTSIVLAYHMIAEGLKKIHGEGANPMRVRREMEQSVKEICSSFEPIDVDTDEMLFNVANTSMESPDVAKTVAEAVSKAGEDGMVIVEESSGTEIVREDLDGLTFDKGYVSPFMVTNPEKMEAVLEDVHVLVTNKTLNLNKDLFGLLEEVHKRGHKQILVIAADVQGELLSTLIANRMKGIMNAVCVKMPHDREMLEDISVLVGAQTVTEESGVREIGSQHLASLGVAKKVVVRKGSCSIVGNDLTKDAVEQRIKSIKHELETAEGYHKSKLKERLAKLVGGVVVLKVGASTEAEMKYLKLKVDDAVAASRAALSEGIMPGGGYALYSQGIKKAKNEGDEIVRKACQMPIRIIIENSGENPDDILSRLEPGQIWNAATLSVCDDPIKEGIIDPVKVEKSALRNAASLAGIFLTTHAVVCDVSREDGKNMV